VDSLTQLLLGAAVAAVCVPPQHRRRALLAGAVLGTLPDLDVLPLNAFVEDPLLRAVRHRGASHSLFVLLPLGLAIFALLRRIWAPVREHPRAWCVAILLAFATHVLLDALTIYGTQLWWPLPVAPTMVGSIFIIDPAYTLWLAIGCVAALWLGSRDGARRWLAVGLAISTAYLGWSLVAKAIVERQADRALAAMGLGDAPRFSVPMPLNTLLWRVVALAPDGYVEAVWSIAAPGDGMVFDWHESDLVALDAVREMPSVARFLYWNRGFVGAAVEADRMVLSDLRMGAEPTYAFRFEVAQRDGSVWRAILPVQRPWSRETLSDLPKLWARIWNPR